MTAVALALGLLAAPLAPASADETDDTPSADEVAAAEQAVTSTAGRVAQIEGALAAAHARVDAANLAASQAAEAYNGAVWQLGEARADVRRTALAQRRAAADVEQQRSGIVTLVTESYQNGTELSTATALLDGDGPAGLMSRQAVVESAGESMDARFQDYEKASGRAEHATDEARAAERTQEDLAAEAEQLAASAASAAQAAASASAGIAAEREQLIGELARAQQISVSLATRRQEVLERRARERAAAEAAAADAAATQATTAAAPEAGSGAGSGAGSEAGSGAGTEPDAAPAEAAATAPEPDPQPAPEPDPAPAPKPAPAPAPTPAPAPAPAPSGSAVQRAVDYAYAQVGKPYLWAADGPDSFDCSGLTMQAWARGGKSLPHYSVAQYSLGSRVPVAQARAGDLLFWSSNGAQSGIHHVALALGGGRYIEAPRTGLDVRVSTYDYWYPTFAVRLR